MKFLTILLMGKTFLLTQDPISIGPQWVELAGYESISAISPGASIQVDISKIIVWNDTDSIDDVRRLIHKSFPNRSIKAKLIDDAGTEVIFSYHGNSLINKENILLPLHAENGAPVGTDFQKVIIYSDKSIKDVLIYWKNYKK